MKKKTPEPQEMYVVIDTSGNSTEAVFKIAKDKKHAEEIVSEMMSEGASDFEIEIVKGLDLRKVEFTTDVKTTHIVRLDN